MIHRQRHQCCPDEKLQVACRCAPLRQAVGLRRGYRNDNRKSFSCLSVYGDTRGERDAVASGSICHVA